MAQVALGAFKVLLTILLHETVNAVLSEAQVGPYLYAMFQCPLEYRLCKENSLHAIIKLDSRNQFSVRGSELNLFKTQFRL